MTEIVLNILSLIEKHPTLFGVIVISFQLFIQHRSTLTAQRENIKAEFKLKVFEELTTAIREGSKSNVASTAWSLPSRIEQYWWFRDQVNGPVTPIRERANDLRKEHDEASELISKVGVCLERYEIVIKGIKPVRGEYFRQLVKFNSLFSELFTQLLRFLPFECTAPNGQIEVREPLRPTPDELKQLKKLCDDYYSEMLTIQSYLMDLSHLSQKELLGTLFNNKIDQRKPAQPEKYKVLQIPMPREKKAANE